MESDSVEEHSVAKIWVLVHSLPLAGHVIIRNSNSIFGKTPDGMRQSSAEGWAVVLEAAGSCDYRHGCG